MAFKQKGFNPGVGTGMGSAFTSSPNRIGVKVPTIDRSGKKKTGDKTKVGKGKFTPPVKVDKDPRVFEKKSINKRLSSPNKQSKQEIIDAAMKKVKEKAAEIKKTQGQEAAIAYIKSEQAKIEEGKSDYVKHLADAKGPGTYVKEGGTVKTAMKDLPMGSEERKAEYDRRGWKYDDTIAGYNRDGSKKEETPTNEPESDPTPDPTETTDTGGKMDDITEPEYQVASGSGRKKTTVTRKDGKVITDEYTHRNIGDKRKRTVTDTEKNRSMTHNEKFDKKGKKKKDKKKITLPDGTVVKVKEKGGKKKVKIRKKGQLFAKKVDPSELENM